MKKKQTETETNKTKKNILWLICPLRPGGGAKNLSGHVF